MKRFKRKFVWVKCESTLPRPLHKYCVFPGCGAELDVTHWACREHWILYPKGFRLYGNSFKAFWEGHPTFDVFWQKAKELGERIAAGESCIVFEPTPEEWAVIRPSAAEETTGADADAVEPPSGESIEPHTAAE